MEPRGTSCTAYDLHSGTLGSVRRLDTASGPAGERASLHAALAAPCSSRGGAAVARTFHTDLQEVVAQDVRGPVKQVFGCRHLCHNVLGHAHRLRALAREEERDARLVVVELGVAGLRVQGRVRARLGRARDAAAGLRARAARWSRPSPLTSVPVRDTTIDAVQRGHQAAHRVNCRTHMERTPAHSPLAHGGTAIGTRERYGACYKTACRQCATPAAFLP